MHSNVVILKQSKLVTELYDKELCHDLMSVLKCSNIPRYYQTRYLQKNCKV